MSKFLDVTSGCGNDLTETYRNALKYRKYLFKPYTGALHYESMGTPSLLTQYELNDILKNSPNLLRVFMPVRGNVR